MRRYMLLVAAALGIALLGGCGGGAQQARSPQQEIPGIAGPTSNAQQAAGASVEEFNYHGWKALRLSNGIVTLVAVPQIGGRIIEYKIGSQPLLWVNPIELGKEYDAAGVEQGFVPDFGGNRAIPAESDASDASNLARLLSSAWTYEIVMGRGRKVEITMTSPASDEGATLQVTRSIAMYSGSTQVQVTDTFTNIGENDAEWSIQHTSQLLGSLSSDAKFSPEAKIYVPLNPESSSTQRFAYLESGGGDQFVPIEDNALLEVSNLGQAGYVGVDSMSGWAAWADAKDEYAFVQRFVPEKLRDYPNQNSSVTVQIGKNPAYMELGLRTPTMRVAPGDSISATFDWYATRIAAPVRDVTDVAAIHEAPKVEKVGEEFKVSGKFGVFANGELRVYLKDADGLTVGEAIKMQAGSSKMVEFEKTLPADAKAATVVMELSGMEGSPLGEIAAFDVAPTLAVADDE